MGHGAVIDGLADADHVLRSALAGAMAPRVVLAPDEWADQYRMIPEGVGDFGGQPWKTDRTPYLREPMRAFADPDVRTLVLVCGSQLGKTEVMTICLLWEQAHDPCHAIVAYPSGKFGGDISKDRVIPTIEQSPRILEKTTGGRDAINTERIKFSGGGRVYFVGAGADSQAKGRTARSVFLDEIEEMPESFVSLIKERGKTFANPKIVLTSTPGNEGEGIDAEMATCQVFEHALPCPHCAKYFALTFDLLHWGGQFDVPGDDGGVQSVTKTGSQCTPEEAEDTTSLACPSCGAACYEHHKQAMLARGVWLAEGEHAELVDGRPAIGNPQPRRKDRAFRINSLYSPFMTWGKLVYDFAKNHHYQMTPDFVRGYLAQPWAPAGDKPQVEELKSICKASTYRLRVGGQRAGETVRAPLPESVRLLTVGVDIQKDEAWIEVRGWGAHCQESYLVDFGPVPCPDGYELEGVLGPVLGRTYQTIDGRTLRPWAMAVDSGYRTQEVYDFAASRRHGAQLVLPVKGQPGSKMAEAIRPTLIDRMPDGSRRKHGVQLLNVNTDVFKTLVMGAIKASAAEGDKARDVVVEGIDGTRAEDLGVNHRFCLPVDCPETYRSHVTSERRQKKSASKRASARYSYKADSGYEWVLLPGRRNEGLDTTVYQFALVGFRQLGRLGRLQMDAMNDRLVRPERSAPPLAGLEDRLKHINARRRRR